MSLRLKEIDERKIEIRELLKSDISLTPEQLTNLEHEIDGLMQEKEQIMARKINPIQLISFPQKLDLQGSEKIMNTTQTFDELVSSSEYRNAFFKNLQNKELSETEKRVFQSVLEKRSFTTDPSSAAAVIPTTTHDEVIRKLRQSSALFPNITVMNLPGKIKIPVEVSESAATWVDELDNIPEGGNEIGYVNLDGYTLAKLIPVSIAAESMGSDAFERYLVQIIADKMSIEIEKAILNGTGTGQPTGILSGVTFTEDVNKDTYTNITYNVMLKPFSLLKTEYVQNASWVMNSKTLYERVATLVTSNGESIFIENTNEGFAGKLLGKPVIVNDYMPDDKILFGNFRYYFMNFSHPITFEKSTQSGFRRAVVDYRSVAVVDGKPGLDEAFVLLEKA